MTYFILGAEHVSVHWGAEPANSEGFPVCHEDGEPDEGAEDQVQTDWGWQKIHVGQKLPGNLQRGLIIVLLNQMFNGSYPFCGLPDLNFTPLNSFKSDIQASLKIAHNIKFIKYCVSDCSSRLIRTWKDCDSLTFPLIQALVEGINTTRSVW